MNDLKNTKSDLSITINIATEIYTKKKPFLIQYCINKKLKSTGNTNELRARLSRYLKGTITLNDIHNTLSEEERNLILIEAKANKINFKQLERAAQISESSDSSPDIISKDNKSIPGSFSDITKDNLRLYDNLNTSTSSFLNRTESILENTNTTYQNLQKEKPEIYQNTFKDLNTDNTSDNIYEKLNFNQTENSENKEGKLINLNKSTNNFNSNEISETTIFDDNSTIIITKKQTNDNLNSDIHSISLNKTTQKNER
ncbi:hypothetical protein AGLY_016227 [Aphis glycines]|uniref:Uncharacterized protein n=1 Tax=Aphis glycines TaxID=307491 RepID=A0A6G0SY77_APHGL|nr:hypothetical protein AGLY_016227 [Aphis glycines]